MKSFNWDNNGGLPFTQTRMKFVTDASGEPFAAIAKLCGDKTILHGVVVAAGNVSDGWISYNGELIQFIGGAVGANVVIDNVPVPFTFGNNSVNNVLYNKTATCGAAGAFPFTDLVPLLSLQNVWMPGDVKEKYCNTAYITTNFDPITGVGLNADKGWRILSFAVPGSAGKTFINYNPAIVAYDEPGKTGGAATATLLKANLPPLPIELPKKLPDTDRGGGSSSFSIDLSEIIDLGGTSTPFCIINPFFVILKLIKL